MRYHLPRNSIRKVIKIAKKRQTQNCLYGLTYPPVYKNPWGYAYFRGVRLLFLPNLPGGTLIKGGTFIPDPRVRKKLFKIRPKVFIT